MDMVVQHYFSVVIPEFTQFRHGSLPAPGAGLGQAAPHGGSLRARGAADICLLIVRRAVRGSDPEVGYSISS